MDRVNFISRSCLTFSLELCITWEDNIVFNQQTTNNVLQMATFRTVFIDELINQSTRLLNGIRNPSCCIRNV